MPKKKSNYLTSLKKNKLLNIKYVFLCLAILIAVGFMFLQKINSTTSTPPYNYKFAYSYKEAVYAYDLKTNQSTKLTDEKKQINEFAWSKNNKIAYSNEAGELYSIDLKTKISQLLIKENAIGTFFWDKNNTLYATNKIPDLQSSGSDKAFHVNTDGTKQEISLEEYDNKSKENLIDIISPASFDKSYYSKSSFKNDQETQTFLTDNLKNKEYKMPDGAYKPQLSANNYYASYNNNASNADGYLYFYKLKDIESGKFDKPIYKKDYYANYTWIDNTSILFSKRETDPADNTYGIFNLKTGKEKIIYSVSDSPVYINDLYITPDKKYLVLRKFKTDYFSGGELIFIDLNSGKEIKKIPFNQGAWSEPL